MQPLTIFYWAAREIFLDRNVEQAEIFEPKRLTCNMQIHSKK